LAFSATVCNSGDEETWLNAQAFEVKLHRLPTFTWSFQSGSKPVEEGGGTHQGEGGRASGTQQHGNCEEVRGRLNQILRGWSTVSESLAG
jgi:hypothetical protein